MWRLGRKHFGRGGALYCQSSLQEETDIDLAVLSFFFFSGSFSGCVGVCVSVVKLLPTVKGAGMTSTTEYLLMRTIV